MHQVKKKSYEKSIRSSLWVSETEQVVPSKSGVDQLWLLYPGEVSTHAPVK